MSAAERIRAWSTCDIPSPCPTKVGVDERGYYVTHWFEGVTVHAFRQPETRWGSFSMDFHLGCLYGYPLVKVIVWAALNALTGQRSDAMIQPTYFVQHPDGSYSEADPQPVPRRAFPAVPPNARGGESPDNEPLASRSAGDVAAEKESP